MKAPSSRLPPWVLGLAVLALLVAAVWITGERHGTSSMETAASARSDAASGHPSDKHPADSSAAEGAGATTLAAATSLPQRTPAPPLSRVVLGVADLDPVFRISGSPTPAIPFPRGSNSERRFHEVERRLVDPALHDAAPVVLVRIPNDGRLGLLEEEEDVYTEDAIRMVFDRAALDQVVGGWTSRILAPLPDGSALALRIDEIWERGGQTRTLHGEVEGEPQKSVVQIVYHDGIIHGTVARYHLDEHLEYRVLPDGHLMVRTLDGAAMDGRCGGGTEAEEFAMGESAESGDTPWGGEPASPETAGFITVDVVVGYDKSARTADGGHSQIESRIIASVDRMNQTFINSAMPGTELMLLGTIEDPDYEFPGSASGFNDELTDLNNTASSNPSLNTVSDYATALGADLQAFIVRDTDGGHAGLAYRPGRSSVTARTYMTSNRITFVHELGHNYGARHSWGDTAGSDAVTTVHNYGWRLDPVGHPRVRTVMAYDWGWTRIPYFANPEVLYQGARTGQVNGYNASGDTLSDPLYVSGGYVGGLGQGFDGSNPSLGARNAPFLLAEAPGRAALRTRTAFQILRPAPMTQTTTDGVLEIEWRGGDHSDEARIELYKGGVLVATLLDGFAGHQRQQSWEITTDGIVTGSDYMVRVVLNDLAFADSGLFTIVNTTLSPQNITFDPVPPQSAPVPLTLSATGGGSGQPVVFTLNSGPATLFGNTLTFTGAGTVSVTASQDGNAQYLAAEPVTRVFEVTRASQSISFAAIGTRFAHQPHTLSATGGPSGQPVVFTLNSGPSTLLGNTLTFTGAGTVSVTASQAGDALYEAAATVTRVFEVVRGPQSITFPLPTSRSTLDTVNLSVLGGSPNIAPVFELLSGPGSLSGTTLSFTGEGIVTLRASKPGDALYEASNIVESSVEVTKPPQTINFPAIPGQRITDTLQLSATGGASGNPVILTVTQGIGTVVSAEVAAALPASGILTFIGPGTVSVTATQAGNDLYTDAAPVTRGFSVLKAPATISISSLSQTYDGSHRGVSVTTDPPGVSYSVTYNGSSVVPIGAGTYLVSVSINDPLYQGSRTDVLTVAPMPGSIELSGLVQRFDGTPKAPFAATDPPGEEVRFTFDGQPGPPSAGGYHRVVATFASPNYHGHAEADFLINRDPVVRVAEGKSIRARSARQLVRGSASDPDGDLSEVRFIDSRPKGRKSWRRARGSTRWSATVPLRPGRNAVRFQAVDRHGGSSRIQQVRIIYR